MKQRKQLPRVAKIAVSIRPFNAVVKIRRCLCNHREGHKIAVNKSAIYNKPDDKRIPRKKAYHNASASHVPVSWRLEIALITVV